MIKEYWEQIKNIGLSGLWLLLLYFVLVALVLGSLGGYSFQKTLENTEDEQGKAYTIEKLEKANNEHKLLTLKIKEISEKLTREEKTINENDKKLKQLKIEQKSTDDQDKKVKLDARTKYLKQAIEKSESQVILFKDQLSEYEMDLKEYDAFLSLFYDFNFFEFYKKLYGMPIGLLTLVLTMSMGALGSLIFITLEYFKEDTNKSFSWYLFRPFLGMATALAVFVFAKAGQLTISDQGISENLNPYFLSFLGIISGLVSEHATDKLRATGATIFRSDSEKKQSLERWAVSIEEVMEKQNKSVPGLVPFVNVPEETIIDWVSEKKPVPVDEQKIIAAWLAVPRRQLFTDLPPSNKKAE